jgi:hypothetical protein
MEGANNRRAGDPVKRALVTLANPNKSGILIGGSAGSGKSFVLARLLSELSKSSKASTGTVPLLIRPTRGTRDAALAAALRSASIESESTDRIREAEGGSNVASRPSSLTFEDPDLLDGTSLSLLSLALDRDQVRLAAAWSQGMNTDG